MVDASDRSLVGRWMDGTRDTATRGTLGSSVSLAPLGAKTPPKSAAPGPAAPAPPPNGIVLRAVGNFPKPAEWTPAYLNKHWNKGGFEWFPMTPEFGMAAAGPSFVITQAFQLLGLLFLSAARIARVNFFSHAAPDSIGISGHYNGVPKGPDDFAIEWDSDPIKQLRARTDDNGNEISLPGEILEPYANLWGRYGESADKKYQFSDGAIFSLADARRKFTSDAILWLYMCNLGADDLLLQLVANTFQVRVGGFSQAVGYSIEFHIQPAGINLLGLFVVAEKDHNNSKVINQNRVRLPEQLDSNAFVKFASPQTTGLPSGVP